MDKDKKFYIAGGIGDILQCLPFAIENKENEYIIQTHYNDAKYIFNEFKINNTKFFFFQNSEENIKQAEIIQREFSESIQPCERKIFHDFQFDENHLNNNTFIKSRFLNKNSIVGIHPFGSVFSNDFWRNRGCIEKIINKETIYNKANNNLNFLIFGSKEEFEDNKYYETDNIKLICNPNIIYSLSAMKLCKIFIGTDSCFKNMACMSNIKSYCLMGDYKDDFRDLNFINPYLGYGVLEVFKINKDTSQENISEYFEYAYKNINTQ
jgi:ADP-heptose:LPS heptosyltransferase